MTDRSERLRRIATEIQEEDIVDDAFLAKSFTDRLLIIDVMKGETVSEGIRQSLNNHGLEGAEQVYSENHETRSFVGETGDVTRHHFVDTQTRGSHQSYVVE